MKVNKSAQLQAANQASLTNAQLLYTEHTVALFDSMVTAVWIYDIENYGIIWANKAALSLWESDSLEELIARDFKPGSSDAVQQTLVDYQQLFRTGKSLSRVWRFSPKDILKEAYCLLSGYQLTDGRMGMLVEAVKEDLIEDDNNASSVVTLSTYTLEGKFLSGNPPFLETQEKSYDHLRSLFITQDEYQRIRKTVEYTNRFEGDVQIRVNKQVLWHRIIVSVCEQDKLNKVLLVQQFNIEQRKQKEIALEKEVITDPLTGLLNRRGLQSVIEENQNFILFYIDLDGFKLVNDSLGHCVGDQLLQHLGLKLTSGEFEKGCACRCGGDEFIWLVNEEELTSTIEDTANLLIKTMNEPFCFDTNENPVSVSASIGIAHYPKDGEEFDKLIQKADAAMYSAKKQGKHRWVNYVAGMEDTLRRHSKLAQHLYKALENQEFELHYQPIFDVQSKQVKSLEALLRWDNPQLGRVSTEECIRVAEEIGIILDIEKWVIATAISDVKSFKDIFHQDVVVAINISSQYFSRPECVAFVTKQLTECGLRGESINIELTESTLLTDAQQETKTAFKLYQQAIPISIDDFGTGYSSLSYLHKIPATFVKIDRSFTTGLEQDTKMMASIQQLLKSLQFQTVIEGVETIEQSKILLNMGLQLQQGYGLGLPQPMSFYLKAENIEHLPGFSITS